MEGGVTRRAAALGLGAVALGGADEVPPRRVVSLGQCIDPMLMRLADPAQIAAVTHYSRDPNVSAVASLAGNLPFTNGSAEEVIALKPDLVLASKRNARQTQLVLKGLGLRVETFEVPETVAGGLSQIRKIAALIGRPERAQPLIDEITTALALAAPPPGARPLPAVIYQNGGLAAGSATLIGEMLERCGFENVAARYGLRKWGALSLERLLDAPPRVLLVGEPAPGTPRWGARLVMHPALAALEPRMHRVVIPARLLYCSGPVLVQTAAVLAQARRDWAGNPQRWRQFP